MKQKYCMLILCLLFSSILSCTQKPYIQINYKNPSSELIPLLLSRESLDENWVIEKIFATQNNPPFSLPGLENAEELSAVSFVGYYEGDVQNNILVEHTLYRFLYPPTIPNNIISAEYEYLGEKENGIKSYIKCETIIENGNNNNCDFIFVKNSIISTLAVLVVGSEEIPHIIDNIKILANPLLVDIEAKLASWEE